MLADSEVLGYGFKLWPDLEPDDFDDLQQDKKDAPLEFLEIKENHIVS